MCAFHCGPQVQIKLSRIDLVFTPPHAADDTHILTLKTSNVPVQHQPAAVGIALSLLTHGQPNRLTVTLDGATMSNDLAAVLATAAANGWPHISLTELEWPEGVTAQLQRLHTAELRSPLTDGVLAELRQCMPWAEQLRLLEPLELQSAVPAGTVLPWRTTVAAGAANLQQWQQAALLGRDACWEFDHILLVLKPQVRMRITYW